MTSREDYDTQAEWLYYLQNNIGNNQLRIALSSIKDGVPYFTKWYNVLELFHSEQIEKTNWILNNATHRTICKNEFVLDFDEMYYHNSIYDAAKKWYSITKQILEPKYIYAYTTGSKGIHIHVFLQREIDDNFRKLWYINAKSDKQKTLNTMIAIEGAVHWKSSKKKERIDLNATTTK